MDASLESLLTELLPIHESVEDYVGAGTEMFSSQGVALASMEDDANDITFSSGSEMDYLNDEMFRSTEMDNQESPSSMENPLLHGNVNQIDSALSARDTTILEKERPLKKVNVGSNRPAGSKLSSYVISFETPSTAIVSNQIILNERQHVESVFKVNDRIAFPSGDKNSSLPSSSSSRVLSENQKLEAQSPNSVTRGTKRGKDHIIAERLRREKLAELFISLSALIPGLKKVDKASVLSDAVKYVKQLKERVNLLEEQNKKTTVNVSSAVCIKKTQFKAAANEDDSDASCSSSVENPNMDISCDPMPEVVVRVSDKYVLIRIQCGKLNGVLANIYHEIDNLHLSVVHTTVLPFGDSRLEVTIVAEMVDAYKMTAMDIARLLRVTMSPVCQT